MSHFQHMLWQSEFDLRVHSYSEEKTETLDLALECQKILSEWTGIYGSDDSKLGEGKNNSYLAWDLLEHYAASFYCYLLAEVYTIDILNKFFAKDPMNRKQGHRFRQIVLKHRDVFRTKEGAREAKGKGGLIRYLIYLVAFRMTGRSEATMSALEKFMGRPLSTKAFIDALRAPGKR
ncbi:hypothetical protein BKA61DRAFT_130121 [Leptodontidium sp. MPI-SDFR-AT-0119]|nr:hypothetical protein BKA61DRAFT_130121 [Leptodontidium sp. MPI-SDFR-AT-0119]